MKIVKGVLVASTTLSFSSGVRLSNTVSASVLTAKQTKEIDQTIAQVAKAQVDSQIPQQVGIAQVGKIKDNRLFNPTELSMVKKMNYGDDGLWDDTHTTSLVQVAAKPTPIAKGMTSFVKGLAQNEAKKAQKVASKKKGKTKRKQNVKPKKTISYKQCIANLSKVISENDQELMFSNPTQLIDRLTDKFCMKSAIAPFLQNLVRPNFCFYSGMILINRLQEQALRAAKKNKKMSKKQFHNQAAEYCGYLESKDYLRRQHLVQAVIDKKPCLQAYAASKIRSSGAGKFDPISVQGNITKFCQMLQANKAKACEKPKYCLPNLLGESYLFSFKVDVQSRQVDAYGDCIESSARQNPGGKCAEMTIRQDSFSLLSDANKQQYCQRVVQQIQKQGIEKISNMCAYLTANLFQPYYWFVRQLRITETAKSYQSMAAQIADVSKGLQTKEKEKASSNKLYQTNSLYLASLKANPTQVLTPSAQPVQAAQTQKKAVVTAQVAAQQTEQKSQHTNIIQIAAQVSAKKANYMSVAQKKAASNAKTVEKTQALLAKANNTSAAKAAHFSQRNPTKDANDLIAKAMKFNSGKKAANSFLKALQSTQVLKSADLRPKNNKKQMAKNQSEVIKLLQRLQADKDARNRAVKFIGQLLKGEKSPAEIKKKVGKNTKLAQEFQRMAVKAYKKLNQQVQSKEKTRVHNQAQTVSISASKVPTASQKQITTAQTHVREAEHTKYHAMTPQTHYTQAPQTTAKKVTEVKPKELVQTTESTSKVKNTPTPQPLESSQVSVHVHQHKDSEGSIIQDVQIGNAGKGIKPFTIQIKQLPQIEASNEQKTHETVKRVNKAPAAKKVVAAQKTVKAVQNSSLGQLVSKQTQKEKNKVNSTNFRYRAAAPKPALPQTSAAALQFQRPTSSSWAAPPPQVTAQQQIQQTQLYAPNQNQVQLQAQPAEQSGYWPQQQIAQSTKQTPMQQQQAIAAQQYQQQQQILAAQQAQQQQQQVRQQQYQQQLLMQQRQLQQQQQDQAQQQQIQAQRQSQLQQQAMVQQQQMIQQQSQQQVAQPQPVYAQQQVQNQLKPLKQTQMVQEQAVQQTQQVQYAQTTTQNQAGTRVQQSFTSPGGQAQNTQLVMANQQQQQQPVQQQTGLVQQTQPQVQYYQPQPINYAQNTVQNQQQVVTNAYSQVQQPVAAGLAPTTTLYKP